MPIISPGLIFVQKAFLLGLFSGELIFGGACYQKQFYISKWVWLVKIAGSNSPWAYIREGLLTEGHLRLRFGGGGGGGLFSGGLIYLFIYLFIFFFGGGGADYRHFTVSQLSVHQKHPSTEQLHDYISSPSSLLPSHEKWTFIKCLRINQSLGTGMTKCPRLPFAQRGGGGVLGT